MYDATIIFILIFFVIAELLAVIAFLTYKEYCLIRTAVETEQKENT